MSVFRFLTGWARAEISGAEPEKILCALAERGIVFWDAAPPVDFSLKVSVPWRAARLLPALCQGLGCECKAVERYGLPRLLSRAHRVALLGVLASVLLVLGASWGRIWDISIQGNETISDGEILQALSECGIDIGRSWLGYSQDTVRNSMILKIPQIRWMTVSMQGCRAVVLIREKRPYIQPVQEDEYAAIVAEKAGLVTEVNALRGTAVTESGKTVLPGETLVAGYATGRFGVQGPVRAIGSVWAQTWYDLTMERADTVAVKTQTGTKKTMFSLILGKIRINFYKGSSICPVDCDKIIDRYTVGRVGVFSLPLTLERITLRSYTLETEPAQESREELSQLLLSAVQERIGEDGQVQEYSFTTSSAQGVVYVTLHAQCWEQIGTTVPLTEAELADIRSKIPQTEETDS